MKKIVTFIAILLIIVGCGKQTVTEYIKDDYVKAAKEEWLPVSKRLSEYDEAKKTANIELVTDGGNRKLLYYKTWQRIEDLIMFTQKDEFMMNNVDYFRFTIRYGKKGPEDNNLDDYNTIFLRVLISKNKLKLINTQQLSTSKGEYDPSLLKQVLDVEESGIEYYPKGEKLKRIY